MVRRPFKDKRPLGPLIGGNDTTASSGTEHEREDGDSDELTIYDNDEVTFESLDDLPDSPMLREYVKQQANYFDEEPEVIINSQPVKDYMRRLGVWDQAVEAQT